MVKVTLLLHFYDDDGVFIAQRLTPIEAPSFEVLQELIAQVEQVGDGEPSAIPLLFSLSKEDISFVHRCIKDLFLVASPDGDNLGSIRVMQVLPYDLKKLG